MFCWMELWTLPLAGNVVSYCVVVQGLGIHNIHSINSQFLCPSLNAIHISVYVREKLETIHRLITVY
jgi:hypothetical protein